MTECPNCGYEDIELNSHISLADENKDKDLCRIGELLNDVDVRELLSLIESGKLFNKQGNRQ